jgi:hypothetical protein
MGARFPADGRVGDVLELRSDPPMNAMRDWQVTNQMFFTTTIPAFLAGGTVVGVLALIGWIFVVAVVVWRSQAAAGDARPRA